MAEIVLKVRDGAGYLDGDILCAFTDRRIACVHAESICHPKNFAFRNGLRQANTLLDKFLQRCYQYLFQRTGEFTLDRIELATSQVTAFSNVPNAAREHIDVPLFIARRRLQPHHQIFGTAGAEYWYGGRWTPDVDAIWTEIEAATPKRRVDHVLAPLGRADKRSHLALRVNDMTAVEADELVVPVTRELEPGITETLAKRKYRVDWRALSLPASTVDIEDRTREVDIREAITLTRSTVVQERVI